nr:receptor-type tyrosine-protein phosphatase S-like isoform X2 [Misgurnus anguillicaudatus]
MVICKMMPAGHLPYVPTLLSLSALLLSPLLTGSMALSPPKFTKVPVDMIAVSGDVVSFVCQATGDPKPRVTWGEKGKRVNSQRTKTIEFDEGAGAVLRIQPIGVPRDETIYECVAENSEGKISAQAKLSIITEDVLPAGFPKIHKGPQLKVVQLTDMAIMWCTASGNPKPEITWFKDFLPIDLNTSNGRIKQLKSGALQIKNAEETDQGKYECVASNVEGVQYSKASNLYVAPLTFARNVPPRFSILPTSHEIMPGGSVNITCVAVGSPMPYVKWMLSSEDLTPEEEMPVGRNVLELHDVQKSANYTCVAMSGLAIIEAVAQIIVMSLPKPPGTPVVTETTSTSITITWDRGNPETVSYYMIQYRAKSPESKFETVESITTTRYSIGGLSPNTDYEIRVSAFNTIGQGPPSEPVEARTGEQAPASPPRNIQARIISQNTMMVRWDEPEKPNGQIKGYRVYYTMDPSEVKSMWQIHNVQDSVITTIQSLEPLRTCTIRVLAFTSVGDGPFSDPIHVKVLQGVPGQPSNFQVGEVSDTSVQLTWEPAFEKEGIISYELYYKEGIQGPEVKTTFGPPSSHVVEGLRANTEYYFSLAAVSNKGIGAFTNEISQRTSQASVFGDKVKSVSVMEGDSVTLHTYTDILRYNLIEWWFGDQQYLIARINREANSPRIYDDVLDGRFKDRLKLNTETGDLTIKNFKAQHIGHYKLEMFSEKITTKTFSISVFGDEVKSVSVMEGDSLTLHTDTKLQTDDLILWRFGDQRDRIAKLNKEANTIRIYADVLDGRFRSRLKLNTETGDLTIINITTQHTGDYKLEINGEKIIKKTFSVRVSVDTDKRKAVMLGDSVTAHDVANIKAN